MATIHAAVARIHGALVADMEDGTLLKQLVSPGHLGHRGDIIAAVETPKGAMKTEVFEDGFLDTWRVPLVTKVAVGTPIVVIRAGDVPDAPQPTDPPPPPPPPQEIPDAPSPDLPPAPLEDPPPPSEPPHAPPDEMSATQRQRVILPLSADVHVGMAINLHSQKP